VKIYLVVSGTYYQWQAAILSAMEKIRPLLIGLFGVIVVLNYLIAEKLEVFDDGGQSN
jgi:hypothetical protein